MTRLQDRRPSASGRPTSPKCSGIKRDHAGADQLLQRLSAPTHRVVLVTLHRPENVDDPVRLRSVLTELADAGAPVLLLLHPRTQERVHRFGLAPLLASLHVTGPVGYAVFLSLAERAALLVSDSGGIQEEATVLGKRLLVLRRSTEHPEAVRAGMLLVEDAQQLGALIEHHVRAAMCAPGLRIRRSPFGDGAASHRILSCLASFEAMSSAGRNR